MSFSVADAEAEAQIEYVPYPMKSGIAPAANLREAFLTEPILQKGFSKVLVMMSTPVVMVPTDQFRIGTETDIYNHAVTEHENDLVMYSVLTQLNAVALFAVNKDLKTVIDIANEIAPEHLELCVDNPFDWLDSIRHAGSVFMGRNCPEALGDYLAGPNHTLPTQGTAKFSSPLSVDDFVKKTQYTYFTKEALAAVAEDVAAFARMEGLTGHARSALIRTQQ